jgi:hypothetical protein
MRRRLRLDQVVRFRQWQVEEGVRRHPAVDQEQGLDDDELRHAVHVDGQAEDRMAEREAVAHDGPGIDGAAPEGSAAMASDRHDRLLLPVTKSTKNKGQIGHSSPHPDWHRLTAGSHLGPVEPTGR